MTEDQPRVDLASRWVGGTVMAASDESFGEKEHLLDPEPSRWQPGRFGPRGELVDGWETRRRRAGAGEDWALVRLGVPGVVEVVDVDTSSFSGNHPVTCRVEATGCEGYPGPAELLAATTRWEVIVADTPLGGDAHHHLPVSDPRRWTHLRLVVAPDGGVARLRVLGWPLPDPRHVDGVSVDLASQGLGGVVVASSDEHFSTAAVVNRPDRARDMGEGWETRRRRDGGHDWLVVRLGYTGTVARVVIDTSYYRYNASAAVALHGRGADWSTILARTALQPDTVHDVAARPGPPVGEVRLEAFPDGGISRLRVVGHVDGAARADAGRRWWAALPVDHAEEVLRSLGLPAARSAIDEHDLPERLRVVVEGPGR